MCANLYANATNSTLYSAVCATLRSAMSAGSRMSNQCQIASLFARSGRSLAHLISIAAVDVTVHGTVPTLTEMVLLKFMWLTRKEARDLLTVFYESQTVQRDEAWLMESNVLSVISLVVHSACI